MGDEENRIASNQTTESFALERYKAKLDFWKVVLVSGFAAIAIASIPPGFQFATAWLEDARKSRELAQSQASFHDTYIKDFVEKALKEDVEFRIRLAMYFANVSDSTYKEGWKTYLKSLEDLKQKIRADINKKEQELYQEKNSNQKDLSMLYQLNRELEWAYAELGYVRPGTDASEAKKFSFSGVCGVTTRMKSIPAANVGEVAALFELDHPSKIDKIDNRDGTFDVVATFPSCADGKPANQPNN